MTEITVKNANLTQDPEVRYTNDGKPVVNLNLAHTKRYFDRSSQEWKDGNTSFYRCAAFGPYAEAIINSPGFAKGARVLAVGDFELRQFERKDGSKGTSGEVKLDAIGLDPRFKPVGFVGAQGQGGQQQNAPAPQQDPAAQDDPFGPPSGGGNDLGW